MPATSEVVVLGAGAAGCAAAYYLARESVKVTVIEREAIGCGASGYALGLLNPLTGEGIPGPMEPVVMASFRMHQELWPALRQDSGVDFQAELVPHLELCFTPEDVARQRAEMERWSRAGGFTCRWLEGDEVRKLEPRLSTHVVGAVLLERVGMLDSYRYTLALAQAAERHGATIRHGVAVGVREEGAGARVVLQDGELTCGAVVVALGPWSDVAAQWLGTPLPVEPLKGEIIRLEGLTPPLKYHLHGACSVVQKRDGQVWVAATVERAGFDTTLTPRARDTLMHNALEMVPSLVAQRLTLQTACLRPVTPDSQPIIGRAPGHQRVFLATGAEKKGILISPAMGKAVADLVLRGKTDLPVGGFGAERFAEAKPIDQGSSGLHPSS